MTVRNEDFMIQAGDDVRITPHDDGVRAPDGSTKDITGYSALVTLATEEGGTIIQQYDETHSKFTFTDPANGQFAAIFDSFDTEQIADDSVTEVYYEVELQDQNVAHTVTTGTITVRPSY